MTSQVKAFEARAASKLIDLGADLAIVLAERKNEVRISGRSTLSFFTGTGIHLAQLFSEIETLLQGSSGGHPTAAGANGAQNGPQAMSYLIDVLKNRITAPKTT